MPLPSRWARAAGWLTLWALCAPLVFSQAGQLSGRIVDDNGEPVIGATVLITGTQIGAAADLDGDYTVLRIPPGTYTVRFSSIGYQTKLVEEVRISSNRTTELDVILSEETLVGEEVVVTAERPLVDVTLTSTMATLSREEIDLLPVQSLDDIVNLQAGVVDGHFRGGRLGEVQYQVDGVSVNDPFNNSSSLELDRSVLQEVQVISGTFDAEYGQALSGVVNAVLRTGDADEYAFSFETFIGEFISPGNDSTFVTGFFNGRTLEGNAPLFPNIDRIDPLAVQNYQASLSGPVPLVPNTTFLINGQRFHNAGYLLGRRLFLPTDSVDVNSNTYFPTGDGEFVPLNTENRWNFLGKITNRSIPRVELSYQAVGGFTRSLGGGNYAYRYNPDGITENESFSIVHGLDLTHTLSNTVFYELSLRQNYFDFQDARFESLGSLPEGGTLIPLPDDSPYAEPRQPVAEDLLILPDPDGGLIIDRGVVLRGVQTGRFARETNTYVAKGAVTAQVGEAHLIKAGGEIQASNLVFGVPGGSLQVVDGRLAIQRDTLNSVTVEYNPIQAALFAQDRIELGDLRIRAGLRLEYFDARSTLPSDLANPANSIEGAPPSPPEDTTPKIE
ncbi:MAG: TonB-dependent receptor, partial [Bacteroidota bacterium]